MYRKIVVGTDLSKTAGLAVQRASELSSAFGAELTLVYAGRDPGAPLQELGERVGAAAVAVPGPPADVLVTEAQERGADLLIVGSVGMSGARRFLLGNVPNKVSHHAGTDLLIVKTDSRAGELRSWDKILVGTDGSPTATRAVEAAASISSEMKIPLTVVCAYEPPSEQELDQMRSDPNDPVAQWSVGRDVRGTPEEFRWRIAGAAQATDVLERASEHAAGAGIDAEVRAVEGHPAEVLMTVAEKEGFGVIAVGSVGMTGPKRFMLGNVPHRVSHHAATDVLILRTT